MERGKEKKISPALLGVSNFGQVRQLRACWHYPLAPSSYIQIILSILYQNYLRTAQDIGRFVLTNSFLVFA